MKRKFVILLTVLSLLSAAGCRLARPEKERQTDLADGDRFCGFYVVPYKDYGSNTPDEGGMVRVTPGDFYDNPNLTAYGTDPIDVEGIGTVDMERKVLFARDPAGNGDPVFPGMPKGYYLIAYQCKSREDAQGFSYVSAIACNMAPGEKTNSIVSQDEGDEQTVSGTIYYGPPANAAEDWWELQDSGIVWRAYPVWETADERLYLDGSGDSYRGPGNFGFHSTYTYSHSENGKTSSDTITADVSIKAVPRAERLTVYQYDGENSLLSAINVPLSPHLPDFACEPDAAWVVVESVNTNGALHTAYDLAEEEIWYDMVLLDEEGLGAWTQLHILP